MALTLERGNQMGVRPGGRNRGATLCRRGKNKFIVGMGMPTYSLI